MHQPDLIDLYVFGLWRKLPMRREVVECILEEVEGHLRSRAEQETQSGGNAEEAQSHAVEAFGALDDVAARFRSAHTPTPFGRAMDIWREMHIVDRWTIALVVLLMPFNLELFRGGIAILAPLFVGALLSGLLLGFLVPRDGRIESAALAALLVAAVYSPAILEIAGQHHAGGIRQWSATVVLLANLWPIACFFSLCAAVGVFGSAMGRLLRKCVFTRSRKAVSA